MDCFRQSEFPVDSFHFASSPSFLALCLTAESAAERCCLRGTSSCLALQVLWEWMLDRSPCHLVPDLDFVGNFLDPFVVAATVHRSASLIESSVNDLAMPLTARKEDLRRWLIDPAFSSSRAESASYSSTARRIQRLPAPVLAGDCFLASSRPRRSGRQDSVGVPVVSMVAPTSRPARLDLRISQWQKACRRCLVALVRNPESYLQKFAPAAYSAIDFSDSHLLRNDRSTEVAAMSDQHPVSLNPVRFHSARPAKAPSVRRFVAGRCVQELSPALTTRNLSCDQLDEFVGSPSLGCQSMVRRCLVDSLAGLGECFRTARDSASGDSA